VCSYIIKLLTLQFSPVSCYFSLSGPAPIVGHQSVFCA
jgi:hypothetical protein